jgi:hypothetical protein
VLVYWVKGYHLDMQLVYLLLVRKLCHNNMSLSQKHII